MFKSLVIKYVIYANILLKKSEKLLTIFGKNKCELDIVLSITVNILITNMIDIYDGLCYGYFGCQCSIVEKSPR